MQYFTAPVEDASDTQGGDNPNQGDDGDKLKILRPSKDKLCFPAVMLTLPSLYTIFAQD